MTHRTKSINQTTTTQIKLQKLGIQRNQTQISQKKTHTHKHAPIFAPSNFTENLDQTQIRFRTKKKKGKLQKSSISMHQNKEPRSKYRKVPSKTRFKIKDRDCDL
ncbi:hypothetical protein V6Z11_D11G036600 [Gossypium hirsutum]